MRVLIAGLGSAGQRHARNLRALFGDDLELLAFRQRRTSPLIRPDMTADTSTSLEESLGIRPFDDLDAALAEDPTAVIVATPAHLHVHIASAAARAGCHVLIEKPVSHELGGVAALSALLSERELVGLVGYQLRFDPGFQRVQQLLAEKHLGALLAVRASYGEYLPDWHPYEDYRESYAAKANQGGGVLLTQIHDLDLLQALFGMPQRVFAVGGHRSSLEIDVEDVVGVQLDCGGLPVHLHQDLVRRPPVRTYEIVGQRGTIVWDQRAGTVEVSSEGAVQVERFENDRDDLFLAELRHFLACIDGSERPVVDVEDAAGSLRVALAAKRSLATGEAVTLA